MKKIVCLFIGVFTCVQLFAQGVGFKSISLKEALEQAKAQGKMVFVDCYTTLCGPCKMMAEHWTFPGGEAKINEAENRLQLIFEEKPDANQRQELNSNGFKWAPSQGAWQRQLNQNAIRSAARLDFLRPEDGKSPYQLQPFAKRAGKDVSR